MKIWLTIGYMLTTVMLLGAGTAVYAERIDSPYRADVLVSDRATETRQSATRQGMADVLVRISGRQDVHREPAIAKALEKPVSYLLQFSYQLSEEKLNEDDPQNAQRLRLEFDGDALQALLRKHQLPLWPLDRPSTLLWLVGQSRGEPSVQSWSAETPEGKALLRAAQRRGVPLQEPLNDLEDKINAPADKLWYLDEGVLNAAARRYQSEAVQVIRYSQTSSGYWRGSWLIMHEGRSQLFDGQAKTLDALLAQAIDELADGYAERYAIQGSAAGSHSWVLDVEGVKSFADYQRLLAYTEGMTLVRRVQALSMDGETLRLKLNTDGSIDQLKQSLALGQRMSYLGDREVVLQPPPQPANPKADMPQGPEALQLALPGSLDNPLRYRWH